MNLNNDYTFETNPEIGGADVDDDETSISNMSDSSVVEPSFFIIPPRDLSTSVRHRRKSQPWERRRANQNERNNDTLSVTSSGSVFPDTAYRRHRLVKDIDSAQGHGSEGYASILKTLKLAGIMIFIVDSKVSSSVAEILESIQNVIVHSRKVRRSNLLINQIDDKDSSRGGKICGEGGNKNQQDKAICDAFSKNQWCLLYRDADGRLFNLTLAEHTTALAAQFEGLLQSFSVVQAMTLLAVLARNFSCATADNIEIETFGPAYLATILGIVFSEELSLSWTNVAMFIRGFPSLSAYEVMTQVESDWLRKLLILLLAITTATTGLTRKICTLGGIALASWILLANLGSRSWKFMGWKPAFVTSEGCFSPCGGFCGFQSLWEPVMSYALAVMTGMFVPFLGHRQVESGGTIAMESVLRIAVMVAIFFLVSGREEVQNFLVLGSGECSQEYVNMAFGGWWCLSLILCLFLLLREKAVEYWPDYKEPLLVEDHASPVGYKVPHLPDFPIDPIYATKGNQHCMNPKTVFGVGVLGAIGIGAFFVYLGFSNVDDEFLSA